MAALGWGPEEQAGLGGWGPPFIWGQLLLLANED